MSKEERLSTVDMVKQFYEKHSQTVAEKPLIPNSSIATLRINLLREEVEELWAALMTGNLTGVLKELLDIQYVLDGAFLATGLHKVKDAAFIEIHSSNMTKIPRNKREDGKVLKGSDYKEPDLDQFFSSLWQ